MKVDPVAGPPGISALFDRVDDDFVAPGDVQDRVSRQPARRVVAVAEEERERAAGPRMTERQRGIGGVMERGGSGCFGLAGLRLCGVCAEIYSGRRPPKLSQQNLKGQAARPELPCRQRVQNSSRCRPPSAPAADAMKAPISIEKKR